MQSNQKKQQFVTATAGGRYHANKTYSYYHQQQPGGDVGAFSGGPGGAAGASLRLNQYPQPHPPPTAAPQPPQGPPQLRTQQAPPHNPHNATAAPPVPHSQHHTHTHATLTQHSQHHQVLQQSGGVGGHGAGGVGTGVGQVGVPSGPSPAPPGPPHELGTQPLPPGSTPQIQQGSGGSLPVASAHNMMYPPTTQNQPQGPQGNAQGTYFPHPAGPNAPPHQPRPVTLAHSQPMPNFSVMPPNMVHFYHSPGSGNLIYHMPFQPVAPRQPTQHTPPGQYHPTQIAPGHPPAAYQSIHYQTNQGGKHEPPSTIQYRQPHGVFYPPASQPQLKTTVNQAPQREKKTLAIVDPNTGKNILDDMNNEKPDRTPTPPQSSESSARNTPAPSGTPPSKTESAAIAAKFAEEVAKKAAEKDIDMETSEPVRTNKQSDSSSSTVIVSDSRESKEKLNNSIGNKPESVNISLVDSAIGKVVPDAVEAISAQAKQQQQQDSPQQIQLQQYPQQVPQLQPSHLTPQVPPQSLQPSIQLTQSLQQLSQPNVPQLSQPTVQPLSQPAVHQLPQSAVPQLSQTSVQQLPQAAVQQLPQAAVQQLPQAAVQQLPQAAVQQLSQAAVHQLSQPSQQKMQPLPQGTQVVPQLPQHLPQQVPLQPPPKQKSPVPQHPQQPQSQQKQQQQPPQPPQPAQPAKQPEQQLPQPPTETASPQPPSQHQLQQSQLHQTQKHLEPSPKTEPATKLQITTPSEVREPSPPTKPESQLPVKQPNPKPTVVPTPLPKEKESTPEIQPTQSKRPKGPREEPAPPPQDTVDDGAAQPQQPQVAAQPQKTAPHTVQQPAHKYTVQVQNTKEKEKKEKTPEPQVQAKPQPPTALKTSPSPPPVKEPVPPVAPSVINSDEKENEPEPKEKEVNNVECEINNVHEEKEEAAVDEEETEDQEKKEDGPQLKYSYKEDQWSPVNPDGKRQYDRRFLLELQNNPLSLKKPESLPNLEVVRDGPGRPKTFDPRGSMAHAGNGPDFIPDYVKSSLGNKQPRTVGRNSQQRAREPGGPVPQGRGGRGQGKIIVIPSTTREPKLKTTENAWKPSAKETNKSAADDAQVLKAMRGILNKLTPEKFGKLVDTVKTMPINTTERLSAVIDLIFEKAVDEQSFSSTYAQMCQVLSLMSVRGNGNEANSGKQQEVKFRNLIINKCQKEFEKDNTDAFRAERSKEIDACTDPEKKLELEAKLMYDETKMRKRSVGNIRFIGELYKLRMLTSPIMMRIIGTLLERGDEESLECLCKLLTTIGKILEAQCGTQQKAMSELDKYFKIMDKIVQERQTVTRVRFLMMDVIDLRQNQWVPRREDNKPKTKAQVQEEVKREEIEQQMALANNPGRRDDRDRERDRRRPRENRSSQMSDEGWSVASTKGRQFDSARLKTFSRPGSGVMELTLRSNFGDWGRGSSGGGLKDHNENKQQESNRFTVLMDSPSGSAIAGDNRRNAPAMGNRLAPGGGSARQGGFGSKSMPPLNDKESAISAVKKFVAPDRSKSTSRPESRDNSIPREPEPTRQYSPVDVEAFGKIAIAIIDEYTHNSDPEEAKLCVKEKFNPSTVKYFVQFSLEWVLDRDTKRRKMVGQLYHDLILEKLLTVDQLLEGSQESLSMVEDFEIDIPQVCEYLGEVFAPCLNDSAVSIHRFIDLAQYAGNRKEHIFAWILSKAAMIMSPNKVSDLWNSSGLSWSSIVPQSTNLEEFLAKHQVEFTVDKNKTGNQSGWNPQKVEAEFLKLFKRASNDEIFGWIDANIGNDAKSSKFIRALVTALVESQAATSNDGSSIRVCEDFEEKMKNRLAVVLKYVDGNENLEMQCIYALQALCVKHQYPQGLLEKCFNAFYDSEVVSEEAFEEWVNSKDPEEQEGKGVCITSVQNFMRWLKEADEEG